MRAPSFDRKMTPSLSLQAWLQDPGSFIQRLRQYQLFPIVKVLRQDFSYPLQADRATLSFTPRRYAFIREVEIRVANEALMFARTTIPLSTLTGKERRLAFLGSASLGSVLFSYPRIVRSAFEIKTCRMLQYSADELWQRQSFFYVKEKPLLLTEVFLPPFIRRLELLCS